MIVLSLSGLASCGDGGERASEVQPGAPGLEATATEPTATVTVTAPPTTAAAPTAPPPAATTPTTPAPTTTEIGAPDGEAIRIPADFRISGGGVTPGRITVPAFLTIALSATSADGRAHALRITTPKGPITLNVPAGGSARKQVEGLPAGEYIVALDGQPTDGALVVGGEPGP